MAMKSHSKSRAKMTAHLLYTMEQVQAWNSKQVVDWLRAVSVGSPPLEKDLERNTKILENFDGKELLELNNSRLEAIEFKYNSQLALMDCIRDLVEVEGKNEQRRRRAWRLAQTFLNSDEDHSGTIERQEIVECVKKTFPDTSEHIMEVYYNVLRKECDKKGTGAIILSEFADGSNDHIMMKVMAFAEEAEKIEKQFHALDKDNSGFLDREEIKQLVLEAFPGSGPTKRNQLVNNVMAAADIDGSGAVEFPEFIASDYVIGLLTQAAINPFEVPQPRTKQGSPRREGSGTIVLEWDTEGCLPVLGLETCHQPGLDPAVVYRKAEDMVDHNVNTWDDAAELYILAASGYQAQGKLVEAGEALVRATECYQKLGMVKEARETLQQACGLFLSCGSAGAEDAMDCLMQLADMYLKHKTSKLAVGVYVKMAEILAEEMQDPATAVDKLVEAAAFYGGTSSTSANLVKERVAVLRRTIPLLCRMESWEDAKNKAGDIMALVEADIASPTPTFGVAVLEEMFELQILLTLVELDTSSEKARKVQLDRAKAIFKQYAARCKFPLAVLKCLLDRAECADGPGAKSDMKFHTEGKTLDPLVVHLYTLACNVVAACARDEPPTAPVTAPTPDSCKSLPMPAEGTTQIAAVKG